ncbi:longevity assurance proteins LAG1/LAC1 [Ceratobasidium sp. AG-I]|nr:longevity assurance proteins LAG1/LAC1 [Ceratobasidium sp. AG-I]
MADVGKLKTQKGSLDKKRDENLVVWLLRSYWQDATTLNWTRYPGSSFRLAILPVVFWCNWELSGVPVQNPFSSLLFISNPIKTTPTGQVQYAKSYADLAFIAYYIVVFSFIRQFLHFYAIHPLARHLGLRGSKEDRFVEQAYSFLYYGSMGVLGLFVMRDLPTWWYRTEHFWLEYPQWEMNFLMKWYYLLQTSYWAQQLFVLVLKIEKPRKDYTELVIHHLVTIWLIGWSYLVNMTWMGNAVFITMDWSDVFLAASKMFNYLDMEISKSIAFTFFAAVWTYTRHYLNLRMIWSVWYEFWLIRPENRFWDTVRGVWMAPWMRYQIFIPMVLLQCVNLFWYWNIWRIIITTIVFKKELDDDRSEHGDDDLKEE